MSIYHINQTHPGLISVLTKGICDHFRVRITSWFGSSMLFNLGLVLAFNSEIIGQDSHYRYMDRWYSHEVWFAICFITSITRIGALVINGSFPNIKYMPHIRTMFSSLSALIWFQLVLGSVGAPFTFESVIFPMLMFLDIYNASLAAVEMRIDNGRRNW